MGAKNDFGYRFANVGDSDVLVSAASVILHTVTINKSPTTTGILNIYDGSDNTGTLISSIVMTQAAGTAFVPTSQTYDVQCDDGIFAEVTGSLAGGNFTITYT